jgi:hypothetical protein
MDWISAPGPMNACGSVKFVAEQRVLRPRQKHDTERSRPVPADADTYGSPGRVPAGGVGPGLLGVPEPVEEATA